MNRAELYFPGIVPSVCELGELISPPFVGAFMYEFCRGPWLVGRAAPEPVEPRSVVRDLGIYSTGAPMAALRALHENSGEMTAKEIGKKIASGTPASYRAMGKLIGEGWVVMVSGYPRRYKITPTGATKVKMSWKIAR